MTAAPGDDIAAGAAARGRLRTARADRERVVGVLKTAFVQGMLTRDEFDLRVGQALTSRTYAELAAVSVGRPARIAAAQPPDDPAGGRPPMSNPAKAAICAAAATAVLVAAFFSGPDMFALTVVFYFMGLVIAGAEILSARHDKRAAARRLQAGDAR